MHDRMNGLKIEIYFVCEPTRLVDIHGFSDASVTAYGDSMYLRSGNGDGVVNINLLCWIGRVAPLKCLSIPR